MLIPLMVLAALSLTAGFIGLPAPIGELFGAHGESPFAVWLAPVFHGPEAAMAAGHHGGHSLEWLLMAVSSLVALGGIAAGLWIWVVRPGTTDRIAARLGAFHVAVKEKLYVDELYDRMILKPYYALCRAMARLDTGVVDGVVNGVAAVMLTSGHVMKLFHSGYVRSYAIAYVIGAALIVWYIL
jgi:NADH-quinone oxidoreductase subunit L